MIQICKCKLMSKKLIKFLVYFFLFFLQCNCLFLCRNMYYLPNLYFSEIYNINENSSKDQK